MEKGSPCKGDTFPGSPVSRDRGQYVPLALALLCKFKNKTPGWSEPLKRTGERDEIMRNMSRPTQAQQDVGQARKRMRMGPWLQEN